ncbi:transmembrane protein 154 isoform X3 [Brachyhypopomus gauderio]|uniref:transmembrane protein 154 isoform X3 n=1 Tax=Brachyhypopomus gauderio TaxID=698409 RepID=UPI004042EEE9
MAPCFSQRRLRFTTASCHRGLWEMTPKTLLLFSILTAFLTRHVQCQADDWTSEATEANEPTTGLTDEGMSGTEITWFDTGSQATMSTIGVQKQDESTEEEEEEEDSGILIIIAVVTALALFLGGLVVGVVLLICRSRKVIRGTMKEDPYLDASGEEKVPMPMFEDDVPSVMELEMEDLEKWMIQGDGGISSDTKQK